MDMTMGKLLALVKNVGGQGAGGGSTGGGGSVSWNDLTDKPFGTAYEYKEILNTEVEVGENGFGRIYTPSGGYFTHKWVVGQTYKIVFNGVEYLCEAWETDGSFYVGNGDIYGGAGKGGDEPFAIEYWSDNWLYSAGPATYSLIVYAPEETVKKLDSKYLDTWDFVIHRTLSSGTYTSTWAKGNVNDLWNALRNKQCPNVCVVTTQNESEHMNIPIKMVAANYGSNQVHITIWYDSSSGKSTTILQAKVSDGSITET